MTWRGSRSPGCSATRSRLPRGAPDLLGRHAARLASGLSWGGPDAELLHQAGQVSFEPLFHNLAAGDPVDVGAGQGPLLACRGYPPKLTGVPDPIGIADDHHVAFRDEELGRHMSI